MAGTTRSPLKRYSALFALMMLGITQCTERNPMATAPDEDTTPVAEASMTMSALTCSVTTASGKMTCVSKGAASAVRTYAGVTSGDGAGTIAQGIVLGGQGQNVQLASTNVSAFNPGVSTSISADVTVQNLIEQKMGSTDGTDTPGADAIQVFVQQFNTTGGSGTVTLSAGTIDGNDTFLNAVNAPFVKYNTVLDPNEVSAAETWVFEFPNTVTNFTFDAYVFANVQDIDGNTVITPNDATSLALSPTETVDLNAVYTTAAGNNGNVSFTSADNNIATVNPTTGLVTGVADGTVNITAVTGGADAVVQVVVAANAATVANNDALQYVHNFVTPVAVGVGLLANDTDADDHLSTAAYTGVTTGGNGTIAIATNGSFTYTPNAGATSDTHQYNVLDGKGGSVAATATLTAQGTYWFVDQGAAGGDGRSHLPFGTIQDAINAAGNSGDDIVVRNGTYAESPTMEASQDLVGANQAATNFVRMANGVNHILLTASGTPANITGTLTLAGTNSVSGVNVTNSGGTAITAAAAATITLNRLTVSGLTNLQGATGVMTITGSSFGDLGGTGDAVRIATTAGFTPTISGSSFTAAANETLEIDVSGSGTTTIALSNNTFSNNHGAIAAGRGGVLIGATGTATVNYSVTGTNSFTGASGSGLAVRKTATAGQAANVTGTITGGTFSSTAGNGLELGMVGRGTHSATVTGGTYTNYAAAGISYNAATAGAGESIGTGNIVIQSNSFSNGGQNGILMNVGTAAADDTYNVCFNVGGTGLENVFAANAAPGANSSTTSDIRITYTLNTPVTVKAPGITAGNVSTTIEAYFNGRNTGSTASRTRVGTTTGMAPQAC